MKGLAVPAVLALLLWLAAGGIADAQPSPDVKSGNEAIYMYRGADRAERLAAKAKLEGTLVVYSSLAPTESSALTQAFEKKYGVKVELWRAVSEKVLQRTITEAQAKRYTVDVIETNGVPDLEILMREKLLSEFYSPYIADLPSSAVPAHRQWISDRMQFFVVGYNTDKVRREDIPATYEGFLDPKWQGRLGIEANDGAWLATIVKLWGEERGMAFFRKLGQMRPDVRKGHILLSELIAAGEIPVGLTVYNSHADALKRKGAPIDWVAVEPVVALPQAIAVARQAPHPNAALLFADFVLSPEGQELFVKLGRVPSSLKVKTTLNKFQYALVDSTVVVDESEKWDRVWNDIFLKR
ncbi:MAG: extracellular solute-binding protein [Pseudomonadota bacterium]|nr:extracellular solute-binding protein [Pseudomonadota bacterium]